MSKSTLRPERGCVYIKPIRLKTLRNIRGLSQSALAQAATKVLQESDPEATLSESLVALIETGRRQPSRTNCEALSVALDVDVEVLADTTEAA